MPPAPPVKTRLPHREEPPRQARISEEESVSDEVSLPEEQLAIRDVLKNIIHAWLHMRGDAMATALQPHFAETVVIRGPGFLFRGAGRDFAISSYQDSVSQAEVKSLTLGEPQIDLCRQTAIAQYTWQMTYALGGQEFTEQGHDLFLLSRRSESWVVIWRAMLPVPR
jgi:hypothetical protein